MSALNLAKTVKPGMVVAKRGNKFIRCGRRARPVGIFQAAAVQRVLTDDGVQTVQLPRGIVFYGIASVQVSV